MAQADSGGGGSPEGNPDKGKGGNANSQNDLKVWHRVDGPRSPSVPSSKGPPKELPRPDQKPSSSNPKGPPKERPAPDPQPSPSDPKVGQPKPEKSRSGKPPPDRENSRLGKSPPGSAKSPRD